MKTVSAKPNGSVVKVVFANNKGGVGKTTITVQAAFELAKTGLNVAVIDLDPQANASRRLGFIDDPDNPVATLAEALVEADLGGAKQVAVTLQHDGYTVDLLPSIHYLENRVSEAATIGATRRLVKLIKGWEDAYDVILMDTPPNMGHLTQLAFAAGDVVIGVTEAEYDSIAGINRIAEFVELHAEDLANPDLRFGGVIVNKFDAVTNLHRAALAALKDQRGDLVMEPVVKKRISMAEANGAGVSIDQYEKELTQTFAELAQSIIEAARGEK